MVKQQRWIFSTLMAIVVTVLSTMYVPDVPELEDVPFFDKWVHFLMYAAMTFAMWFDWWRMEKWMMPPMRVVICSFAIPALWGVLMELVQSCLPYRSGDWLDALANSFGALLGVIISYSTWKIVEKTSAAN